MMEYIDLHEWLIYGVLNVAAGVFGWMLAGKMFTGSWFT